MTTYFTLDRRNRLAAGMELSVRALDPKKHCLDLFPDLAAHTATLFPDGLSDHGERYVPQRANIADVNIELIWEYVRRAEFPHRPSRLTSTFAWATLDEAKQFRQAQGVHDARIFEIRSTNAFVANMSLLNNSASMLRVSQFAHTSWRGEEGPKDAGLRPAQWEVLLPAPVVILGEVAL